MWSFATNGCQYGASKYFLIKGYSGRVLADGELGVAPIVCGFAPKNVLQVIIRVDGFHESGFVKPRCRKSTCASLLIVHRVHELVNQTMPQRR